MTRHRAYWIGVDIVLTAYPKVLGTLIAII